MMELLGSSGVELNPVHSFELCRGTSRLQDDWELAEVLGEGKKGEAGTREHPLVLYQEQRGTPGFRLALAIFLLVRLCCAFYADVADCDESFNYWEPTHYLMYGYGFQTWEYSPAFSIRSYAYVGLHALVGHGASFLFTSSYKIMTFYAIRSALGALCALAETVFYCGVAYRFGSRIGNVTLLTLLASAGMFVASTAYLPSSFSMYFLMLSFGFWFGGRLQVAVMLSAFGCIMGWPFSIFAYIPLALDCFRKVGIPRVVWWAVLSFVLFLGPAVLIDFFFFGKVVCAVCNIMLYNATSASEGGGQLYGVEPWHWYMQNLVLNFNVLFPMALGSVVVALVLRKFDRSLQMVPKTQLLLYVAPLYIWLGLFSYLPHKEERFMFVVFPVVCWAASMTGVLVFNYGRVFVGAQLLHLSEQTDVAAKHGGGGDGAGGEGGAAGDRRGSGASSKRGSGSGGAWSKRKRAGDRSALQRLGGMVTRVAAFAVCAVFVGLCAARISALRINYGAPSDVYTHLYVKELQGGRDLLQGGRFLQYKHLQGGAAGPEADPLLGLGEAAATAAPVAGFSEAPGGRSAVEPASQVRVCVGKEWYRFPSNFFLPNGDVRLWFLLSSFDGQLPKPFAAPAPHGTRLTPPGFNGLNKQEFLDRYLDVRDCHYVVDLDLPHQVEPHYFQRNSPDWDVVASAPFLDVARSPNRWLRAFWIPQLSLEANEYAPYVVLRNRHLVLDS